MEDRARDAGANAGAGVDPVPTPQGDGRAGRDAAPGGPTMAGRTAIRQAQRLPDGTARTRPVHLIPVGASPVPPYQ